MILLLPLLLILLLLLLSLSYYYFFIVIIIIYYFNEPIQPEGSPFGRFSTLRRCEFKEQVSTQTYLYNPSIQPSLEFLVINWMVNSRYGPYHL